MIKSLSNRAQRQAVRSLFSSAAIVAAALLASLSTASAQVITPPNAATNSPISIVIQSTASMPALGATCNTYNLQSYNWQTGERRGCINGTIQPLNSPQGVTKSGTASNSDANGQVTLAAGSGSYSFTGTYSSAPICVAVDTTAANAVKVATTTSALTLTGTSTDVINYICSARN